MKRFLCFLLIAVCLLTLAGCRTTKAERTANFYYVRSTYSYGAEDSVLVSENRNIKDYSDIQEIMDLYLIGPEDNLLLSPFPHETQIIDLVINGKTLYVTLSSHIAALSKVKQVLACVCFARTVMELTDVSSVYFQSDHAEITRMDPIVIDRDSFLLYDNYDSLIPTETE